MILVDSDYSESIGIRYAQCRFHTKNDATRPENCDKQVCLLHSCADLKK